MQKTSIVLQVSVSDGSLNSSRMFTITLSKLAPSQKITFLDEVMQASIPENIDKEHNLVSVNPTDNAAITCLAFRILNPSPHFEVGEVSGVLISRGGHPFDREKISNEMVHVEVTQGEPLADQEPGGGEMWSVVTESLACPQAFPGIETQRV